MRDARDKRPRANDHLVNGNRPKLNMLVSKGLNGTDHQVRYAFLNKTEIGKTAAVLSSREIEVLCLISFGHSSKEIAIKLFLSTHTVTNHRKNMLSRSRCRNIAELVRIAMMEKLL